MNYSNKIMINLTKTFAENNRIISDKVDHFKPFEVNNLLINNNFY